jgi:hypothetical protein
MHACPPSRMTPPPSLACGSRAPPQPSPLYSRASLLTSSGKHACGPYHGRMVQARPSAPIVAAISSSFLLRLSEIDQNNRCVVEYEEDFVESRWRGKKSARIGALRGYRK